MDLTLSFIEEHYHFLVVAKVAKTTVSQIHAMLSDFKLNSSIMIKKRRKRAYRIPKGIPAFCGGYNEYRRSIHQRKRHSPYTALYLEVL